MTAIAALTAQNTRGVAGVLSVPADFVVAQIDAVLDDLGADAVKIGMIGSPETVHAVAERLDGTRLPVVFDPVMVATSGSVLADAATIAAFERLMAVSTLVTPNAPELAALAGDGPPEEAAARLTERHDVAVLAKGGDLPGAEVVDILIEPGAERRRWSAPRIETRHTHGTGCTLASAIATGLGRGLPLAEAIEIGRAYVRAALQAAPGFGAGHGPMDHALGTVPFDLLAQNVDGASKSL